MMLFSGHGNEQTGWRPGLIFQNNKGNCFSPNVIALPITSSIKKKNIPTHVFLPSSKTGLLKDSLVLCENPERMSKNRIGKFITRLPDEYMSMVAKASLISSGAISFLDQEELLSAWKTSTHLNFGLQQ